MAGIDDPGSGANAAASYARLGTRADEAVWPAALRSLLAAPETANSGRSTDALPHDMFEYSDEAAEEMQSSFGSSLLSALTGGPSAHDAHAGPAPSSDSSGEAVSAATAQDGVGGEPQSAGFPAPQPQPPGFPTASSARRRPPSPTPWTLPR